jgi:hypothetical protein
MGIRPSSWMRANASLRDDNFMRAAPLFDLTMLQLSSTFVL